MRTRAAWRDALVATGALLAVALPAALGAGRQGPPRRAGDPVVDLARRQAGVPAIGWASVTGREIVAMGGDGDGATEDAVFDAASIAKLVVATAVMQLVDEGAASLDEDVSTYVGFPVHHRNKAITLRMLLAHTSRIRDHDLVEGPEIPLGAYLRRYLVERGASAFEDGDPGSAYAYSNVGYALAAYAVERVRATPFAQVTRQRVFGPLGMRSTTWSARASDPRRLASPHAGGERLPSPAHAVWPAADLHSTARDLGRFAMAMLCEGELGGERVLSRESTHVLVGGLGFQIRTLGGARVVGHEGEDQGASTALFLDPSSPNGGAGAVVLANGDAFASDDPSRAAALQDLLVDLLTRARQR